MESAVLGLGEAGEGGRLTQNEVIGMVNEVSAPRDVVVCAAGSMPGDLHKMWRVRDRKGYHVEYGFSTMGYEIPGGIGIRMAAPDRDVFVMIGDGSYLMMPTELVTAVKEGVKIVVVLVQNHGFASIGALSEQLGSQRFGTRHLATLGMSLTCPPSATGNGSLCARCKRPTAGRSSPGVSHEGGDSREGPG